MQHVPWRTSHRKQLRCSAGKVLPLRPLTYNHFGGKKGRSQDGNSASCLHLPNSGITGVGKGDYWRHLGFHLEIRKTAKGNSKDPKLKDKDKPICLTTWDGLHARRQASQVKNSKRWHWQRASCWPHLETSDRSWTPFALHASIFQARVE